MKNKDNPTWVQRLMDEGYRVKDIRLIARYAFNFTEDHFKRFGKNKEFGAVVRGIHHEIHTDLLGLIEFMFPTSE